MKSNAQKFRFLMLILGAMHCIGAMKAAAQDGLVSNALTIYSEPGAIAPRYDDDEGKTPRGYALVKQERAMTLGDRRSKLRFTDVAERIDATTVSFVSLTDPAGTRVLEQDYEFDLVDPQKLMERFIDHEITIEQAHGDKVESVPGILLSAGDDFDYDGTSVVIQTGDGGIRVIRSYSAVQFPKLPDGLITRPTLVWDVVTEKPGPHRVRVTYETGGMAWWADYNIVFTEGKDANSGVLDVGAWVSILNLSGATYGDAKLKLIAGDVHRAPKPAARAKQMQRREMAIAMADASEAGFEEKLFFEYHLYTLGRPTTLPDNSTKQIELFPTARGVQCEKVLVYYGLLSRYGYFPNPMTDRNYGVESNPKVDIYLQFKNSKEAGMGMPLPAGRIRVSKLDAADGTLEFIGEDKIDHTPKDEKVLIKMGSAFDVVGERKQLDFKADNSRKYMEEEIEIKVRNHKEEPVKVIVKENLYRWANWQITKNSHEYEKIDARTVYFPIEVAKDGESVVKYTVKYTW